MNPLDAAESLSAKGAVYWFFALLFFMGIGGVVVVKWLVKQKERQAQLHAGERKQWQIAVETIAKAQQSQITQLAVLLTRCIGALDESNRISAELLRVLRKAGLI